MRAGVRFYENSLHAPHLPPRSSTISQSVIPRSSSKNQQNSLIADDASVVSISDLSTNSSAQSSNPEDHTARLNMAGRTPHAKQIAASNNFEQLKENLFFNESMFKLPETFSSNLQKNEAEISVAKGASGTSGPLTDISNNQQFGSKRSETKIQSSIGIAEINMSINQDRKNVHISDGDSEIEDSQKSLIMDQNFTTSEKPNRLSSPETTDKNPHSSTSLSLSQNSNQAEFAPSVSTRPKLSSRRVESGPTNSSSLRTETITTAHFHAHQIVEESFWQEEDLELKRQHSAGLNATLAAKKKAINASLSVDFDAISPNSKGSISHMDYKEHVTGIQRKNVHGLSDSAVISPLTVESAVIPTAGKNRHEKSFLSDLSSSLQADIAIPQKSQAVEVHHNQVSEARYSQSHAEDSYINNLLLGSDATHSVSTHDNAMKDKHNNIGNETVMSSNERSISISSAPSDSDTSKSAKSYNTDNIIDDGGVSLNRRGPKSRPSSLAVHRESPKRSASAPPVSIKASVAPVVPSKAVDDNEADATLNESIYRGNTSTFSYYNAKALMSQKAMNSSAIIDQPHWVGATPRSDRKRPPAIPSQKETSIIAETRVRSSHKKRKSKTSPKSMKSMQFNQASSSSYRHASAVSATTTNHVTVHAPTVHAPFKPSAEENVQAVHESNRTQGESTRGRDRVMQSEIALQQNSSRSLSPIAHRQRTIMNEIAQSVYEPTRVDRAVKDHRSKSASVIRSSVEDNMSCISTIVSTTDSSRMPRIHTPPLNRHSSPTFMSYRKVHHDSDSDDELGIALSELLSDALAVKQYHKTEMDNARSPPGTDEGHSMYTQHQMRNTAYSVPESIVVSPSDTFPSTSSITKSVCSGPTTAAAVVAAMNRIQTVPRSLSRTSSRTSLGNAMRITKHQAELEEIQSIVIPHDDGRRQDCFNARGSELYQHRVTQSTPESQRFADLEVDLHHSPAPASIHKSAETPGMDTILTDMAVKLSNTETNDIFSLSQSYHNTTAHMSSNITLAETTVTLDHSYLLDESGLITPSGRAPKSPIPRMAIRSLVRGEDSVPDVKEIAFVSVPGKSATVKLSFANKQNKPLKLKAQSIQIRFESIHRFLYPYAAVTSEDVTRVEELQHAAEAKVGNFNSFEVTPNILQIQPNCNGQISITFSPLSELVGNYSGALKIKYFKKSFILLLRGEARDKIPTIVAANTTGLPIKETPVAKDQTLSNTVSNQKLVGTSTLENVARQASPDSPVTGSSANTLSSSSDGDATHPQMLSAAELTMKACNSLFERQQELKNKIKSLSAPRVEVVQSSDSESMRTFIDDDVRFCDAAMASAGVPDCMSVITFNQEDSCANISVHHGGNSTAKKVLSDHPFSTAKSVISQINYSMSSDYKHTEKSFDYYSVAADRFQFSAQHQPTHAAKDTYLADMYRSSLLGSAPAPPQQQFYPHASVARDGGHGFPQYTPLQMRTSSNSVAVMDGAHGMRAVVPNHNHLVGNFTSNNINMAPSTSNKHTTTGTACKQSSLNTTFDSFINPQSTSQLIEVKSGVYFRKTKNHFGSVTIGSLTRSKIELCNSTDKEVTVSLRDPNLPFVLIHNEVSLRARSYVRVPVRFLPVTCDDFSAELIAETSDGKYYASILLSGSAHS